MVEYAVISSCCDDWSVYPPACEDSSARKYPRASVGAFGAIACGLLYGAANGLGLPYMAKAVFPEIFKETAVPLTVWQIVGIALWLPMIFLARGLAGYFNAYLTQYVGVRVLEALRLDYFRKLQQLPLAFFIETAAAI
jgi:subfamily B ATP-binding cassette protein MsbA